MVANSLSYTEDEVSNIGEDIEHISIKKAKKLNKKLKKKALKNKAKLSESLLETVKKEKENNLFEKFDMKIKMKEMQEQIDFLQSNENFYKNLVKDTVIKNKQLKLENKQLKQDLELARD